MVQVGLLYVPVLSPCKGRVQPFPSATRSAVEYDEEILILQSDN